MADMVLGGIKFKEGTFVPKTEELKYNTLYDKFKNVVRDYINAYIDVHKADISKSEAIEPMPFKVSDFYKVEFKKGAEKYKFNPSTVKRCIDDFNKEFKDDYEMLGKIESYSGRGKKVIFKKKFVKEILAAIEAEQNANKGTN